jgi:hypothetical protein
MTGNRRGKGEPNEMESDNNLPMDARRKNLYQGGGRIPQMGELKS